MGDTTRGLELLLRIMGVSEGDDTHLPLVLLINMHRARLRAPLEQLSKTYGGTASDPSLRASRVIQALEQRWPALTGGKLFEQDDRLNQLTHLLPANKVNQSYTELLQLARKPSPTVAQLLLEAWEGYGCHDPLVLLHELTHQDMNEAALECYLACLTRELELDPAVMELILAMTDDA